MSASGRWEGQRNGNVMYELGLAHALRPASEMILIRSDDQEINFDIAGIRIQHYDPTNLGIARERIACLVRDALRQVDQIKQLKVIEASQTLDADSLALMTREGQNESFSIPIAHTMRDVMNQMAEGTKMAIRHLLSLGIVRIEVNVTASSHTYHWTQLACSFN